jgi:hypothetical protein
LRFRVTPESIVMGELIIQEDAPDGVIVYPVTVTLKDVKATVEAVSVIVPAVPARTTESLAAAAESVALPVAAALKVVPQVPVPPTPFNDPARVSQ